MRPGGRPGICGILLSFVNAAVDGKVTLRKIKGNKCFQVYFHKNQICNFYTYLLPGSEQGCQKTFIHRLMATQSIKNEL